MRFLRIFLTVFGLILLIWVVFDHTPLVLQFSGKTVVGRVTKKEIKFAAGPSEGEAGTPMIYYEFEAGGKRGGESAIPRKFYNAIETGDSVTVAYWSRDPDVNLPQGYSGSGLRGFPLLAAGCASFLIGFFFLKRYS